MRKHVGALIAFKVFTVEKLEVTGSERYSDEVIEEWLLDLFPYSIPPDGSPWTHLKPGRFLPARKPRKYRRN